MPEYAYTSEHVEKLRLHALNRDYWLPRGFADEPIAVLAAAYNGIGPDKWSGRFRRFTTWVLKFLEAPALVHDLEFTRGGSYWKFTVANLQLLINSVMDGHGISGLTAALLCQLFGWRGWPK